MIEVIHPGLISTVQDLGRFGFMHMGVSRSGALNPLGLHVANRIVGNPANTAAIEIMMPPAKFQFHCDCWIALTGARCRVYLDEDPVWFGWRIIVKKGQILTLSRAKKGFSTYLAVAGGIQIAKLMGSSSTDLKAGFGGFHPQGTSLVKGDQIEIGEAAHLPQKVLGIKLPRWDNRLRVIEGPEFAQFTSASQQQFFQQEWLMTSNSNRMGFRLLAEQGLKRTQEVDILSQGVAPGVIQVPPNGQPIILTAEAQSTGGYPRIASIILADLWKLGHVFIGQQLQFKKVTISEAKKAIAKRQNYLDRIELVLND